jgi:hypothetical protein
MAFLVMDLEARGRPDLAVTFLSAYLEKSADYQAGSCLRFLLVYRALVRAKIAALRAHQLAAGAAEAATLEAATYLEHARRFATRRPGSLVLMHGYSGSGKSTLAARLVPEFTAVQIRADVLRRGLAPATADQPRVGAINEGRYAPEQTASTYEQLARDAGCLLRAGINVIADATFLDSERREPFIMLAREIGSSVAILSCEATPAVLRERIATRVNDASEATLAVLEHQLEMGTRLVADRRVPIVTVQTDLAPHAADVSRALEAALQAAIAP